MNLFQAGLLGAVEGFTEFLPISSTGHMILVGHFLGIQEAEATKAFEVVIQVGAIAAAFWHFRAFLLELVRGFLQKNPEAVHTVKALALAFAPAMVFGFLFGKWIKAHLFGPEPVIVAMIFGGILILLIESKLKSHDGKEEPELGDGLFIGVAQCLALWPGTSRSMATILGARLRGLSSVGAARFSFILAIPTLVAATVWDLFKSRHSLLASSQDLMALLVGLVVSYAVALIVIRAFLRFLTHRSMAIFGWYRIVFGLLLLWFLR